MSVDNPNLDQLNNELANSSIATAPNNAWEVVSRDSANQDADINAKLWGSTVIPNSQNIVPKIQEENSNIIASGDFTENNLVDDDDDISDDDSYDEFSDFSTGDFTDGYDSAASEKSHETRKKTKWLKPFFEVMDHMEIEQINEPCRLWHCPACHDGPVAIRWFEGMEALIAHAKTRRKQRIKLHREFESLLEEELQKRGAYIVWPPVVVVMNTVLEKDENGKWIGMGNRELLDYFSEYAALKARSSHGRNGHSGMSVLIFEASAMGYEEAERLHKKFVDEGRERDAWYQQRALFDSGRKRQLYGFLARKSDLEIFNQQSAEYSLKFELRSYQKMVLEPMRKMNEVSKNLMWYMSRTLKQEHCFYAFEKSFAVVSQILRDLTEENRMLRLRTKLQHEENKDLMNFQECFFKVQMEKNHKDSEVKEMESGTSLQEDAEAKHSNNMDSGPYEDCQKRIVETKKNVITSEAKGAEFEAEKEKLIRRHEEKKIQLQHKRLEEDVELEKDFYAAMSELVDKYTAAL